MRGARFAIPKVYAAMQLIMTVRHALMTLLAENRFFVLVAVLLFDLKG